MHEHRLHRGRGHNAQELDHILILRVPRLEPNVFEP
jgi:hypothetical protein